MKFFPIPASDQSSVLNLCRTKKPSTLHEVMYDCKKTHDSPYDPKELAIHSILRLEADIISNCGHLYKRTVCFINMVHFTDGENILTYVNFDFSITFYPKLLQKSDKPTDTGWKFPNPVKNANAMQVSINLTVLLTRSILLISFWTRKICKTWIQLLLTQSDTLMIVTLFQSVPWNSSSTT